jgi:hypothetical protein
MTNKLPVVGKKYRIKNSEMPWDICEIIDIETKGDTDFVNIEYKERFFKQASYEAKIFNECFEELPEDKIETKDNILWSEENVSECGRFKIKTGTTSTFEYKTQKEEQSISFKDAIYNIKHEVESIKYGDDLMINPASIVEDMLQKKLARLLDKAEEVINSEIKPETQSHISELSPEVKEAMENIRKNLRESAWGRYISPERCLKEYTNLKVEAQNLLNALDEQFNVMELHNIKAQAEKVDKQFMSKEEVKIDTSSGSCLSNNEMKPDENGSFKHLDNAEELSQDIMKKSAEESIWNPVSELPEDGCEKLLIKLNGTVQIANHTFYDDDGIDELYVTDGWGEDKIECTKFSSEEVESFCTLTDFIKDYEKLKEKDKIKEIKLRDLEERVRKLEGK